jgi:hypothetical protein
MLELEVINNSDCSLPIERRSFVREIFMHKNRLCMVMEMRWESISIGTYCNGYVQMLPSSKDLLYGKLTDRIKSGEITFGGTFPWLPNIKFLGFDTAHIWNDEHPETKTFENVKERTILLCGEMVRKRI